jgi:CheY-like chemotaxis protein
VVSAQDGEEAHEFLEGEATWPDFIFLDYQMNVGDSGDEVRRLGQTRAPQMRILRLFKGYYERAL